MRIVVIKKDCKLYCLDLDSSIQAIKEFGGQVVEYRQANENDVVIYKK